MANDRHDPAADFAQLARQYWNAWSEFGGAPHGSGTPGFQDGLAWWSQLAGQGREQVDAAVERMNSQAGAWFGAMQQLAGSFAGRDAGAADISRAWQEMLGGAAGNPVADMFKRMSGVDAHGIEQWFAQAAPLLGQGWRGEADALLRQPAFGLAREHQERWQALGRAQLEYQDRLADYQAQLARAGKLAFERFERKLAERGEPGRQIESARALFDLWIDAAEEAWSEVALGADYRRAYGGLVNAQMRVRAALQQQVEQAARAVGLPTRSEVASSHRKVAQLERELRDLRRELAQRATAPAARVAEPEPPVRRPSAPAAAKPAPRPRAKSAAKSAPRTSARRTVLPQVTAPSGPAARKSPARKAR